MAESAEGDIKKADSLNDAKRAETSTTLLDLDDLRLRTENPSAELQVGMQIIDIIDSWSGAAQPASAELDPFRCDWPYW